MIDIKQAVNTAMEFVKGLYDRDTLKNLLLEEVEFSEDEKYWVVTIGFDFGGLQVSEPTPFPSGSSPIRQARIYKLIRIDKETGKPISLKLKKV